MYLVVIAWIYVVLMMSVAEATNTTGTVLGAVMTFVLYGALPVTLVVYLMSAPARNKAIKKRNAAEREAAIVQAQAAQTPTSQAEESVNAKSAAESIEPDAGSHAAGGGEAVAAQADAGITPVRKEL